MCKSKGIKNISKKRSPQNQQSKRMKGRELRTKWHLKDLTQSQASSRQLSKRERHKERGRERDGILTCSLGAHYAAMPRIIFSFCWPRVDHKGSWLVCSIKDVPSGREKGKQIKKSKWEREGDGKCSVSRITNTLPTRRWQVLGLVKAQRLRNDAVFIHVQQANGA